MGNNLQKQLWNVLAPMVPRLLTCLERDPDSPNLGCFDRDFWHYKIRDFASSILQQGGVSVDALTRLDLPGNPLWNSSRAGQWAEASVDFFLSRQLRTGGFEEYYPFESGYPPAAFGLYAAGLLWQERGFPQLPEEQTRAVQRGVDWLLANPETKALNQEAAGLCGLALACKVPEVQVAPERLEARWGEFFRSQSDEGWFPEYGGPDLGYLCVTLDCLWDYHDLTGDTRAWAAMKRAVAYIASMLAPGGRVPVMANSRNTDYLVPYGLTRLGASDATASACVHAMLSCIDAPDHFLNATDDRYLCHYIGQSFFRSLAHLDRLKKPAPLPCETGSEVVHVHAGQYVRHADGSSLYFAGHKGGVIYLFGPDGIRDADFGWRLDLGKKLGVTHWQAASWEMAWEKGTEMKVRCEGPVHAQGFAASSPIRHMALRVLSFCFGNRLIPLLKNKLIFRAALLPIVFHRELNIGLGGLELTDTFSCLPDGVTPQPAVQSSMRHVASAARFSGEELAEPPRFEVVSDTGFTARRKLG